jgi:hypothetical protein
MLQYIGFFRIFWAKAHEIEYSRAGRTRKQARPPLIAITRVFLKIQIRQGIPKIIAPAARGDPGIRSLWHECCYVAMGNVSKIKWTNRKEISISEEAV